MVFFFFTDFFFNFFSLFFKKWWGLKDLPREIENKFSLWAMLYFDPISLFFCVDLLENCVSKCFGYLASCQWKKILLLLLRNFPFSYKMNHWNRTFWKAWKLSPVGSVGLRRVGVEQLADWFMIDLHQLSRGSGFVYHWLCLFLV